MARPRVTSSPPCWAKHGFSTSWTCGASLGVATTLQPRGHIEELARELGLGYTWDERLGGRRALSRAEDAASPDTWWRVKAFRAYAAWTRNDAFRAGMSELIAGLARRRTVVMCSESVWWRCHRRIIADVAVATHGVRVVHLMHDGRLVAHELSAGARLDERGDVVWDGAP